MKIHASSLARAMVCSGHLFFKDLHDTELHPAAPEGTAAGEYLEHLLNKTTPPLQAKNGIYFDDDMKLYGSATAKDIFDKANGAEVTAEGKVSWMTQAGVKISCRYDASFLTPGLLYVDDYKYGYGIVDVTENWQLIAYAIGEVIRRQQPLDVALRIHQPRPHHEHGSVREWRITYPELLQYKDRIEKRMQQIVDGDKTLTTSSACKYCKGAAEACTAFNRSFYAALDFTESFTQDMITDEEVAQQLNLAKTAKEIIKIKTDSLEQLAISRIKGGKIVPGYMTEKSYGNRSWKGCVNADNILALTGKNISEPAKLLSPAKAEKLGVPKTLIAGLVEKKYKGNNLVKKDASDLGDSIFGTNNPSTGVK